VLHDYRQIVSNLRNSVWFIDEASLSTILEIVNMRLNGVAFSDEEIRLRLQEVNNGERENSRVEVANGIGIMPLYGPIFPKANLMTELSGATSLENFRSDLRSLMNDDSVKNIILDVDSPGGSSAMVMETAEEIRQAREVKPIHAVANVMAGSAALMLATQATDFHVTPSGLAGSLGVYFVHEDQSGADANEGRKITFVSAGRLKTAGNPHEPLTAEARAYFQGIVDDSYQDFVEQVALGRNTTPDDVKANYGEGAMLTAKRAVDVGMADGIKSLDQVVGDLLIESQPQIAGVIGSVAARHKQRTSVANAIGFSSIAPVVLNFDNSRREGKVNEAELRQLLNLSDDDSLEDAIKNIIQENSTLKEEVEPIREVQEAATKQKAFAEAFPNEWAEMQSLRASRVANDAEAFAASYERFSKEDGDQIVKSSVGFPTVTLNAIVEVHKAISERTFSHEQLTNLLNLISQRGFVDFSEQGSTRQAEPTNDDPIAQFNTRVTHYMTEDKLSPRDALMMAVREHPTEYEAYQRAQMAKSTGRN